MNRRDLPSRYNPEESVIRIGSDNKSGAAELLREAGDVFVQLHSYLSNTEDLERTQQAVLDTCTSLALAQPEMTPILRLAGTALTAARTSSDPLDVLKSVKAAALNFIANAEQAASQAAKNAAGLIPNGAYILTHSRSSTVLASLLEAKRAGKSFSVVVTESRPMLEGRTLASSLAVEGIGVTLIADAAASRAIDEVDLVILGADTITTMDVINKIGTRMIARDARARELPLFAICDSSKFISEEYISSGTARSRSPAELWPEAPAGVSVINHYFERTPLEWFNGVVTEGGVWSPVEAGRHAAEATLDISLVEAVRASFEGIK